MSQGTEKREFSFVFYRKQDRDIKQENTQVSGLSSFFFFSGVYVVVCFFMVVGVFLYLGSYLLLF